MHHVKGIATLSVGPRGARQTPSSWTCSVGAHGELWAVQGRSRKRARRSHAARETDNAAAARLPLPWQLFPPHRRISTLFRTLSFFSFPFLFLPWLLGRYLSNYLFNKTCDLSYTYLPMSPFLFFSFLFLAWLLGR